jgi:hypothetical protein
MMQTARCYGKMKIQFDQELAAPTAAEGDWNGRIRQNLLQHSQPARVVPFYKKWLPRVAAVLLLGTATLFYLQRKPSVDVTQAVAKSSLKNNDIPARRKQGHTYLIRWFYHCAE